MYIIFAIAFGLIWKQNKDLPAAGAWTAAYFFGFISWGLEAIYIPFDLMELLGPLADTAYFLLACLIVVGLALRYEQKIPFMALGIVLIGSLVINYWHWFMPGSQATRLQYLCYGMGVLLMIGTWILFPVRRHRQTRLLLWILGACITGFFITPLTIIYATDPLTDTASYGSSFFLSLARLINPLSSVSLAVALLVDLAIGVVQRLREESQTDLLTNLYNRRAFEETARKMRADAAPAALIICDIDHFKTINDTFGHACGDKIIREFANVLQTGCRETDQIGRIGGEEFGVLLPNSSVAAAHLIAENLKSCLERYRSPHLPHDKVISASFGVAELQKSESYEVSFSHADKALYRAKKDGRGCVRSHLAMTADDRHMDTYAVHS